MKQFNILTDALPETVTLFQKEYPIHTSFRNWIQILALLGNQEEKNSKCMAKALKLCYKEALPPNLVSAFLGMLHFLNRGTEISVSRKEKKEPLFSLFEDAEVIYAAFYTKYGIDLTKQDLHWYTFCALLASLPEDNAFQTVLKIRSFDESTIKNQKKRREMVQLKKRFQLQNAAQRHEIDVAENLAALF